MKTNLSVAGLLIVALFISGCDMRHAVKVELKEGSAVSPDMFTVKDVMAALRPAIDKNDLKCANKHEHQEAVVKCKTWSLSYTSLKIFEKNERARIIVEDDLPIFFWTPQPYGRIRSNVISVLKTKYGENNLDCGQGFGFTHCNEWPRENRTQK